MLTLLKEGKHTLRLKTKTFIFYAKRNAQGRFLRIVETQKGGKGPSRHLLVDEGAVEAIVAALTRFAEQSLEVHGKTQKQPKKESVHYGQCKYTLEMKSNGAGMYTRLTRGPGKSDPLFVPQV